MKSLFLALVAIALVGMATMTSSSRAEEFDDLKDVGDEWLAGWRDESSRLGDFLIAAYSLKPADAIVVRAHLSQQIREQYYFEQGKEEQMDEYRRNAESGLLQSSDDAADELATFLVELYNEMPLNPDVVSDWVQSTIPVNRPEEGQMRFSELIRFDSRKAVVSEGDYVRKVAIGRSIQANRLSMLSQAYDVELSSFKVEHKGTGHENDGFVKLVPPSSFEDCVARVGLPRDDALTDEQLKEIYQILSEFNSRFWRNAAENYSSGWALQFVESNSEFEHVIDRAGLRQDLSALNIELAQRIENRLANP